MSIVDLGRTDTLPGFDTAEMDSGSPVTQSMRNDVMVALKVSRSASFPRCDLAAVAAADLIARE